MKSLLEGVLLSNTRRDQIAGWTAVSLTPRKHLTGAVLIMVNAVDRSPGLRNAPTTDGYRVPHLAALRVDPTSSRHVARPSQPTRRVAGIAVLAEQLRQDRAASSDTR